ncbi:MAG: IS200/IS605 family transposase [Chloroflexi bacterium]|nr:IS200/IS605 family transposase [Chloroflexota bacterium]
MPFWKCYYHVIWGTKNRAAVITPSIEAILFHAIQAKSDELRCTILAVNGTPDHVHVAVGIRPSLAVGDWVGQIKGASSHAVNSTFDTLEPKFRWQEDYGVLTFGVRQSSFVVSYVENQKEHHRSGALYASLEQIDE